MIKYKGLRIKTWILIWVTGIKVTFNNSLEVKGRYTYNEIILRYDSGDMVCLHEIGHHLNKYDCCREHDEWRAHGFAVGAARILKIPPNEISKLNKSMDAYSGIGSVCARTDIKFQNNLKNYKSDGKI